MRSHSFARRGRSVLLAVRAVTSKHSERGERERERGKTRRVSDWLLGRLITRATLKTSDGGAYHFHQNSLLSNIRPPFNHSYRSNVRDPNRILDKFNLYSRVTLKRFLFFISFLQRIPRNVREEEESWRKRGSWLHFKRIRGNWPRYRRQFIGVG